VPVVPTTNDPLVLLHALVSLQSQSVEMQRQGLEMQRQALALLQETTQVARDQRTRQIAELERWQQSHAGVISACKQTLSELEQVHASLMAELSAYVGENHENLMEGDFALSEFVDKFGPRLAHINTMLAVLRPLAAAQVKPAEGSGG
jgi:small-conductance mechanosensitive channel